MLKDCKSRCLQMLNIFPGDGLPVMHYAFNASNLNPHFFEQLFASRIIFSSIKCLQAYNTFHSLATQPPPPCYFSSLFWIIGLLQAEASL